MHKSKKYKIKDKDIEKVIKKFIKDVKDKKDSRYLSWNYCYKYFRKIFSKKGLSKSDNNYASLILGFYLASWGMYRGSSFLLRDYTYTIHNGIVDILLKHKIQNQQEPIASEKLFNLIEDIKDYYKKFNKNTISDTLVSKIIMGTSGLIPAYDVNVKRSLQKRNLCQTLSKRGYEDLLKCYHTNKLVLTNLSKKFKYPPMKILDLYLWIKGKK